MLKLSITALRVYPTWELVPSPLKELGDVNYFKTQIEKWQPENSPCRLCK